MKLTELFKPKEIDTYRKQLSDISDDGKKAWALGLGLASTPKPTEYLKQYGWNILGAGSYARVYANPTKDYILKIFVNDPGYQTWLKFMIENQHNKFIPKIKGKPVSVFQDKMFAVRMEKLKPHKSIKALKLFNEDYEQWFVNPASVKIQDKDILDIFKFLKKVQGKHKFAVTDIHHENIMERSDGQLVLIDPLAL